MTSGPRPRARDAEDFTTSSGESLEEFTERTAEVMADARKQVNRARETFHDQIISGGQGGSEVGYTYHEPEAEHGREPHPESDGGHDRRSDRVPERVSDRETEAEPGTEPDTEPNEKGDDTKAAWPNWT